MTKDDSSRELVKAFHRQRRMFAISGGALVVADLGTDQSHSEWFANLGWESSVIEHITRGYVDPSGIYAYFGHDFCDSELVELEVLTQLNSIIKECQVLESLPVYLGLTPLEKPGRWPPRRCLGNWDKLIMR